MIIDLEKFIGDVMREEDILRSIDQIFLQGIFRDGLPISNFERVIIVGCGDSLFVSIFGSYIIRRLLPNVMVLAENSFEFLKYYPIGSRDLVIAISASGHTKATIEAAEKAVRGGAKVIGLTCNGNSPLLRFASKSVIINTNDSVASPTVTTFGLALGMLLLAYNLSNLNFDSTKIKKLLLEKPNESIVDKSLELILSAKNHYFVGGGLGFPLALVGMAKFRELNISHSYGFELEEFMHYGNIPLKEDSIVFLFSDNESKERCGNALELLDILGSKKVCFGCKGCDLDVPISLGELLDFLKVLHYFHILVYHVAKKIYGTKVVIKHGYDIARLIRV